jgi:hypothetical protein
VGDGRTEIEARAVGKMSEWKYWTKTGGSAPGAAPSIRRMPVSDEICDRVVDTNQPETFEFAEGWVTVVPAPVFQQAWLDRGGPPDVESVMCYPPGDASRCVYLELTPRPPRTQFGHGFEP